MVYSVFVEHENSIRSFCKIATTDYKKAKEAFDDIISNRKYELDILTKFNNDKTNFKH